IAFEPQEQTIQHLSQWFAMQGNMQALFDLTVDASLIGGAAFSFNGKFSDFSIRPVFQQMIQTLVTPQKTANPPQPAAAQPPLPPASNPPGEHPQNGNI